MTDERVERVQRCKAREAAKPWGSGWWLCSKSVDKHGKHRGPHSFEEKRRAR